MTKQRKPPARPKDFAERLAWIKAEYERRVGSAKLDSAGVVDPFDNATAWMMREIYRLACRESSESKIDDVLRARNYRARGDVFSKILRIIRPEVDASRPADELRYAKLHGIHANFLTHFRAITGDYRTIKAPLSKGDQSLHRAAAEPLLKAQAALEEQRAARRARRATR